MGPKTIIWHKLSDTSWYIGISPASRPSEQLQGRYPPACTNAWKSVTIPERILSRSMRDFLKIVTTIPLSSGLRIDEKYFLRIVRNI